MFNYAFLKKLDILYIESDETTFNYLNEMLCKQFRNVVAVKTAKEGLEKLEENKNQDFDIDIVICDEVLDDMSGLELLESIRKIDSLIPVILTTKKIESKGLLKAIEYQATDYLEKPINAKDLVFCVENVCQNKYHDKLREQAQKDLEDIIDVINEVALVIKTKEDGQITFVNKYFTEVSSYAKEDLLNQSYEVLKDEHFNMLIFKQMWEKVKAGDIWEGKIRFVDKEQKDFYVYLTVVPIYKKNRKVIKEYMWVSFLATDDELEQKEFKKKAAKNINENRRINTEARTKIDELISKISFYRNIESDIKVEQQRGSKFTNQIKFYEKELEEIEVKLKETSEKASVKIKKVVADEKVTREKRDITVGELSKLTDELNLKNKTIKELTKELDEQIKTIDKLMRSINSKEQEMGI